MGIFDSIGNIVRGQLIDVIEWTDSTNNTIVHKYDMNGKEIMMGAQLTVRESQVAIFVNEGKLADVFQPGRYELSTANMPVMTALKAWKFGFNSPFKSDVYFVNTKQFLDCKWGTTNPVMMRDAEFGMIRLRAFGAYSFRVADPEVFLREVFGTSSEYTVQDVEGQLKRTLVSGLSDAIAESKLPALDLAANYDEPLHAVSGGGSDARGGEQPRRHGGRGRRHGRRRRDGSGVRAGDAGDAAARRAGSAAADGTEGEFLRQLR
mgnify:CR=1 FL=1